MFGVGAEEFIAIIVVALIVLGPERLPVAMRQIGRWTRRLRDLSREFREEFAEEVNIIQEEMGELRREAEETRSELVEIRRELGQTVQETANEVTNIRREVTDEFQGAVSALTGQESGNPPPRNQSGSVKSNGDASPPGHAIEAPASSGASKAADVMAAAIAETFSGNGAEMVRNDVAIPAEHDTSPTETSDTTRLSAFAPELGAPENSVVASASAADTVDQSVGPIPPTTSPGEAATAGIGTAPEPGLRNQMGGFMRLIIMKALESDPSFREQAENVLRSQARADFSLAKQSEEPELLDLVNAWVRQRHHLVTHGTVTVQQKAPDSAVVELYECPYGLTAGTSHPVCDVSNIYDAEFFGQFDATAMYASRMSDGDTSCKLLIVKNERLKSFANRTELAAGIPVGMRLDEQESTQAPD